MTNWGRGDDNELRVHPKVERVTGFMSLVVTATDRSWGSNSRPTVPEANALPLSYPGAVYLCRKPAVCE
jgi:hypothetical protein